jgi:hypothetical protein
VGLDLTSEALPFKLEPSAERSVEVLVAKDRFAVDEIEFVQLYRGFHDLAVFAHDTGNVWRTDFECVWNDAPAEIELEIEGLNDCPITVAGLAQARSGTRSAALIPVIEILTARERDRKL